MRKKLGFLTLLLLVLTTVSIWITGSPTPQKPQDEGKAAIGGGFTLVDSNGQPVTSDSFHGRIMLVFFGFTHCPDICPISTASLSKLMPLLGDKANQVAPLYITVDPERDTPPVMKAYLSAFDKRLIGLTGSPDEVKRVADAYKVYFAKKDVPWDEDGDEEPAPADAHHHEHDHADAAAPEENYAVDHSGFIYMMDRDGQYIAHFPYNVSEQELAAAVKPYLK